MAPTSRGNVTITSASARDKPIINPNWLTTETDQQVSLAAFKQIRDIWNQDPLQSIVAGPEAYPGAKVQSDEQILNAIRNSISPVWHASGTCKMGLENDTHAVLDSNSRVRGVRGLRVVDASAFPLLPPGHPQSTVCEFKICDRSMGGTKHYRYASREDCRQYFIKSMIMSWLRCLSGILGPSCLGSAKALCS